MLAAATQYSTNAKTLKAVYIDKKLDLGQQMRLRQNGNKINDKKTLNRKGIFILVTQACIAYFINVTQDDNLGHFQPKK